MSISVYIIQGEAGEYCDTFQWTYRALFDGGDALNLLDELNSNLKCFGLHCESPKCYSDCVGIVDQMKKLDSNFYCDYTGARYTLKVLEVD